MSLTEAMRWRYAVKKFLPGARDDAALARALEAARLAPSSFGLQPWRIVRVTRPQQRAAVLEHAYGQEKVVSAGHLLIFATLDPLEPGDIAAHVARTAAARGLDAEAQQKLRASLTRNVLERHDAAGLRAWTRAQCYLALGVFLAACAAERLDACPMEGFAPARVGAVLGLERLRLAPQALVAAGRRDPGDAAAGLPKVRLPLADLVLEPPDAAPLHGPEAEGRIG